jgi:hypothetical protein
LYGLFFVVCLVVWCFLVVFLFLFQNNIYIKKDIKVKMGK